MNKQNLKDELFVIAAIIGFMLFIAVIILFRIMYYNSAML